MFVLNLIFEHQLLTLGVALALVYLFASLRRIGPTEVGLVTKRFSAPN